MAAYTDLIKLNLLITGSTKLLVFIICVNHKLRFTELSLSKVNIFQDAVSCLFLEFEKFKVKI